jgi:hypothetical protein
MLKRTNIDWWLAMFELEIYFDDSGTDGGTPVAVAACYVSSKEQWDQFVKNWDRVRTDEGFDVFHMAEFVAKPEAGHKPFCDWDNVKKDRVYAKLASIINSRAQMGFAIAVPKKAFDQFVFPEFKEQYAKDHYTWAVKSVLGLVANWRGKFGITIAMQYVFDAGSLGQQQINEIWTQYEQIKSAEQKYGIVPNGVMFQDDKFFKPLQAADILAWQMQNHLRRTVLLGRDADDRRFMKPGFAVLRHKRPMGLGFFSTDQMRRVFDKAKEYHESTGRWPWDQGPISSHVILGEPGIVY